MIEKCMNNINFKRKGSVSRSTAVSDAVYVHTLTMYLMLYGTIACWMFYKEYCL